MKFYRRLRVFASELLRPTQRLSFLCLAAAWFSLGVLAAAAFFVFLAAPLQWEAFLFLPVSVWCFYACVVNGFQAELLGRR